MRKASIKREIAYKEGLLNGVNYACDEIDKLICGWHSYAENAKLWILRDKMRSYQANLREEINNENFKI